MWIVGGRPASAARFQSVYVCGAAVRRKSVYVRFLPVRSPFAVRVLAVGRAWGIGWGGVGGHGLVVVKPGAPNCLTEISRIT